MVDPATRIALANRLIDAEPSAEGDSARGDRLQRLCSALARVLPAMGVAISVRVSHVAEGGVAAASGRTSRRLDELQLDLAEGPSIDAWANRQPVLESDLVGRGAGRWPGYVEAAGERGVCAVFAFPVQIGGARLGTLTVYRQEAGPLARESIAQALTFADVTLGLLLDMHAVADHPAGDGLAEMLAYRAEVYQAQGMVMVDLDVDLAEAMLRLRAHAYAAGRDLLDVAHDVVAGNLKIERDS